MGWLVSIGVGACLTARLPETEPPRFRGLVRFAETELGANLLGGAVFLFAFLGWRSISQPDLFAPSDSLYQATVQLLIDRDTPNVLPTKEVVDFEPSGDFQTQLELLKGRMLAERVVERANLQKNAELSTGPLMSPWERFQRRFLGKPPASTVDSDGMPLSPAIAAFARSASLVATKSAHTFAKWPASNG